MFNRTSSVDGGYRIMLLAGILWVVILTPDNGAAATFQGLPAGTTLAHGISGDGSVVVGSGVGSRAFRWTVATGVVDDLGTLPGDSTASAFAASADGSVVVGQSCNNTNTSCRAFRWTAATGMVSLGRLPGDNTAEGIAVSADGSVVVGPSCATVCHAFRWTAATGMVDIGMLPGDTAAFPLAVSDDGAVVVGQSNVSGVSSHAFRWTMGAGDGQSGGSARRCRPRPAYSRRKQPTVHRAIVRSADVSNSATTALITTWR